MERLRLLLRQFAREREWDPFHTPKNLAMSLGIESAEVMELFQWLTPEESQSLSAVKQAALADEIGDVLIYLVMLADKFHLDPLAAALAKVEKNHAKYPAAKVRGQARKYSEYGNGHDNDGNRA
ncbi:MAG: nucleotide pyrophosphohydrolase [Magnetococcales bacterium]|nr:nucleotide pyrophosphohydrolase [Magnetococcales bacterium]MBF0321419.1 nucleotide pyrophosphohydrolase [Magnetococcales bacterium]